LAYREAVRKNSNGGLGEWQPCRDDIGAILNSHPAEGRKTGNRALKKKKKKKKAEKSAPTEAGLRKGGDKSNKVLRKKHAERRGVKWPFSKGMEFGEKLLTPTGEPDSLYLKG